jgi:hypothetical protein
MKLSIYAKFAKIIGNSTSIVEGNSDLKTLAEIYDLWHNKTLKKDELGWKLAFPIARYPQLRKYFV